MAGASLGPSSRWARTLDALRRSKFRGKLRKELYSKPRRSIVSGEGCWSIWPLEGKRRLLARVLPPPSLHCWSMLDTEAGCLLQQRTVTHTQVLLAHGVGCYQAKLGPSAHCAGGPHRLTEAVWWMKVQPLLQVLSKESRQLVFIKLNSCRLQGKVFKDSEGRRLWSTWYSTYMDTPQLMDILQLVAGEVIGSHQPFWFKL